MAGSTATTPAAQKAAQQLALRRIVQRVILANAAKEQGLDKDPNFALLSQRADETILAQLLESKTAANVPAPSTGGNPAISGNQPQSVRRAQSSLMWIRYAFPDASDPQLAKKLEPFKTLADIANYLNREPHHLSARSQCDGLARATARDC